MQQMQVIRSGRAMHLWYIQRGTDIEFRHSICHDTVGTRSTNSYCCWNVDVLRNGRWMILKTEHCAFNAPVYSSQPPRQRMWFLGNKSTEGGKKVQKNVKKENTRLHKDQNSSDTSEFPKPSSLTDWHGPYYSKEKKSANRGRESELL